MTIVEFDHEIEPDREWIAYDLDSFPEDFDEEYEGEPEQDDMLLEALLESGAPQWIRGGWDRCDLVNGQWILERNLK
ncbi:hypothetical protein [Magnetofaba australis]|uniref:Uncharacterized protein n=1 Tax=Magnetofaba australis IT-1 TaxID=1434232 RepID=A0A1Y2K0Z3_9PROT|nr:hypothetical protein [Magnetofaba australis]OSM00423.1 hypothetical protein MAIT1_00939 [Magnetofaba australis IT-1]